MKPIHNIVATLVFALSFSAWAGPSVGGGGDVVVLPDDSVVLADPFIDGGAIQPNNMPPLRALNPRILQVINLYQKAANSLVNEYAATENASDINEALIKLATRKSDLRFYGVQTVEELNQFCAPGGRKIYKLPNGAQVQQVACTAGNETFMVEPLFMRLSLRDQGLLLIHERLTTLRDQYGGKNYSAIARFTTGLNVYLNLYGEQNKKKYRMLTTEEQKILTDFFVATEEIEKRNHEVTDDSFQWAAHKFGGGRVHVSASVDESALISLTSVITSKSEIAARAKVVDFSNPFRIAVHLEAGAVLNNVSTYYSKQPATERPLLTLQENAVLDNVVIRESLELNLGVDSKVKNSTLQTNLVTGKNTVIENAKLNAITAQLENNVVVRGGEISINYLKLGNSVSIENSNFSPYYETKDTSINLSAETKITGSTLFIKILETENSVLLDKTSFSGHNYNLMKNVKIRDSKIAVGSFSAGSNTSIESSQINTTSLTLGESVTFRNASIIHSSLRASVARNEQLINKSVYASTYENYYALGYVPKPISLNIEIPTFACVLNVKLDKKITDFKKESINADKDGFLVTGLISYQGKPNAFKNEWNYNYTSMKLKIDYKTFYRNTDENLLMISSDGKFVPADYKVSTLAFDFSSLSACEVAGIEAGITRAAPRYTGGTLFIYSSGVLVGAKGLVVGN